MTPGEKMRAAFDLFTAGVRLMEQNLRRRHPEAGEQEIRERLEAWLHDRPGAEFGDCVGRVVEWRDREASPIGCLSMTKGGREL
jgi:hypothetical protein